MAHSHLSNTTQLTLKVMLSLAVIVPISPNLFAQIITHISNAEVINTDNVRRADQIFPAECGQDFYGNDEMQPQCRRNVRSDDIPEYTALYSALRPEADVNGDGSVTPGDLTLFMDSASNGGGPVVRIQTNLGATYSVILSRLDAYRDAYDNPNANPEPNVLSSFIQAQPCYRFQNLAGTRFGKAYVFTKGAIDIDSGIFKDPILISNFSLNTPDPVCLNNLGQYDSETGVRIATNDGYLQGLYHGIDVTGREWFDNDDYHYPGNLRNVNNDFRVGDIHDYETIIRDDYNHATQVGAYYFYNDYRNRIFTPNFIKSLGLDPEIETNLLFRQFRPDMPNDPDGNAPVLERLLTAPTEVTITAGIFTDAFRNLYAPSFASWYTGHVGNGTDYKVWSQLYTPETSLADAFALVEHWILGVNEAMPFESRSTWDGVDGAWKTNVLSGVNDASFDWTSYRYLSLIKGDETSRAVTEHTREYFLGIRMLNGYDEGQPDLMAGTYSCGSAAEGNLDPDCDKGQNINNVMTMDEAIGDGTYNTNWLFPFSNAEYGTPSAQFVGSDLAGTFIAAVFYDIAHRAGIGTNRADMLFWKTISLIDRTDKMPMRRFGQIIQEAARQLWPDPDNPSESIYEEIIRHSLLMRGIAVDATFYCSDLPDIYGSNDEYSCCPFDGSGEPACDHVKSISGSNAARSRDQLPLPVGYGHPEYFEGGTSIYFSGGLPEVHPRPTGFGQTSVGKKGYTHPEAADYMAYTFLKNSRYGPLDRFILTNDSRPGLLDLMANPEFNCTDSINSGFKCYEFTGEELDNKTVFLPGNFVRYARYLRRADSNRQVAYVEDTAPIGTRAIRAEVNGFSFHVNRTGENSNNIQYNLSVNDPSYNSATDSYSWTITKYFGSDTEVAKSTIGPSSGLSVEVSLNRNQPVVIELTRTRNGVPSTLRIVDRANDLDRSNGEQFIKSML